MRGHAEHGDREISQGVDTPSRVAAVWHGQQRLEGTRREHDNTAGRAATPVEEVRAGQRGMGGAVFRIPRAALPDVERRIEALNRRACRLGCPPIALHTQIDDRDQAWVYAVAVGEAPVLAGWRLIAIVEHHATGATVHLVDRRGEHLDPRAVAVARCDHCQLTRRRTKTYVVAHGASGERRRVGSGCLRDFLGGHDPVRMLRHAEHMSTTHATLQRIAGSGPPAAPASRTTQDAAGGVPLGLFAAHAARVIRAEGFCSRSQARRTQQRASADAALESMQRHPARADRDDQALADAALAWARALPHLRASLSEFEQAAIRAAHRRWLGRREQGLVSALIAIFRRDRARSRHLEAPGDTLQITAVVEAVTAQPSPRYPQLQRCNLLDAQANRLVWWQTAGRPLRAGQVVRLRGRVRRHTHFGPIAVTVLSGCQQQATLSTSPVIAEGD
jgi:hypothetical protein